MTSNPENIANSFVTLKIKNLDIIRLDWQLSLDYTKFNLSWLFILWIIILFFCIKIYITSSITNIFWYTQDKKSEYNLFRFASGNGLHQVYLDYPPASEGSREVVNLTERKNPHTLVYGVKEFVCLSVCYQIWPQLFHLYLIWVVPFIAKIQYSEAFKLPINFVFKGPQIKQF